MLRRAGRRRAAADAAARRAVARRPHADRGAQARGEVLAKIAASEVPAVSGPSTALHEQLAGGRRLPQAGAVAPALPAAGQPGGARRRRTAAGPRVVDGGDRAAGGARRTARPAGRLPGEGRAARHGRGSAADRALRPGAPDAVERAVRSAGGRAGGAALPAGGRGGARPAAQAPRRGTAAQRRESATGDAAGRRAVPAAGLRGQRTRTWAAASCTATPAGWRRWCSPGGRCRRHRRRGGPTAPRTLRARRARRARRPAASCRRPAPPAPVRAVRPVRPVARLRAPVVAVAPPGRLASLGVRSAAAPAVSGASPAARCRCAAARPPAGRAAASWAPGWWPCRQVPRPDPRAAVLEHPEVPERKRFCSRAECGAPVGRARGERPGRTEGFCTKCGHPYSLHAQAAAPATWCTASTRWWAAWRTAGSAGSTWRWTARSSDRWVVLKGLLDTGDEDALAAAVSERRFLAEIEHPNIVRIYNFVEHLDRRTGTLDGYIVMEYVGGKSLKEIANERRDARRQARSAAGRAGHRVRHRGAGGARPPAQPRPALLRLQGRQRHPAARPAQADRHGRGAPDGRRREPDLRHRRLPGARSRRGWARRSPPTSTPSRARSPCSPSTSRATRTSSPTACPTRTSIEVFRRYESFYRLLVRATDPDPGARFASAEEMADQLTGVLREVVALRSRAAAARAVHPVRARTAGGGHRVGGRRRRATARCSARAGRAPRARARGRDRARRPGAAPAGTSPAPRRRPPVPRCTGLDPTPGCWPALPAARPPSCRTPAVRGSLAGLLPAGSAARASCSPPSGPRRRDSVERSLRELRARLELDDPGAAAARWHALARRRRRRTGGWCGTAGWRRWRRATARTRRSAFDAVYDAFPGEPRAEAGAGRLRRAAGPAGQRRGVLPPGVDAPTGATSARRSGWPGCGWRPATGRARSRRWSPCRSRPSTTRRRGSPRSAPGCRARSARSRCWTTCWRPPGQVERAAGLRPGRDAPRAADHRGAGQRARLGTLRLCRRSTCGLGRRPAGGGGDGAAAALLGSRLDERGLRFGLERSYRLLARLAQRGEERIELVERANRFRPRTWV